VTGMQPPPRPYRDHAMEPPLTTPGFQGGFENHFGPPSRSTSPLGLHRALFAPSSAATRSDAVASRPMSRELSLDTEIRNQLQANPAALDSAIETPGRSDQSRRNSDHGRNSQLANEGSIQPSQSNRPPPLRTGGAPHPGRIVMPPFTQFNANPLSPMQRTGLPPMTPSVRRYGKRLTAVAEHTLQCLLCTDAWLHIPCLSCE
jgi:hypothetical protein